MDVVRETPVSTRFAVTVALDRAAPDGSVMTPDKFADTCAEQNGLHTQQKSNTKARLCRVLRDPELRLGATELKYSSSLATQRIPSSSKRNLRISEVYMTDRSYVEFDVDLVALSNG